MFWWDLPDRQEPGPGARKDAVRSIVHRMNDNWRIVREAFKKEQDRAAAYADRRSADYQIKKVRTRSSNAGDTTEDSSVATEGRWRPGQWDHSGSREC